MKSCGSVRSAVSSSGGIGAFSGDGCEPLAGGFDVAVGDDMRRIAEQSGLMGRCSEVNFDHAVARASFGLIFCGRHTEDGCRVVVSVLKAPANRRDELLRDVQRQVGRLVLRHPKVTRLVSYFHSNHGGSVYLMSLMKWLGNDKIEEFFNEEAQAKGCMGSAAEGRAGSRQHLTEPPISETTDAVRKESCDRYLGANTAAVQGACSFVVGDYVVDTGMLLGEGKFGEVYRGKHVREQYDVAIKMPTRMQADGAEMRNEAEMLKFLKDLDHPNVIKMYEAYGGRHANSESTPTIVLELCPGGDLKNYLVRHGPLHEARARRVMRQLVDCLCFLKEHGVMHRDLKPTNILLTSDNVDEAVVKVADWGMAKISNSKRDDVWGGVNGSEMFESTVGTPAYMAPERLDREPYDFQAEVWALGVIMYELLFGKHPFDRPRTGEHPPENLLDAIRRTEELDIMKGSHTLQASPNRTDFASPPPGKGQLDVTCLSSDCRELCRQMTFRDASSRCSIEDVRRHPWFSHGDTESAHGSSGGRSPEFMLPVALEAVEQARSRQHSSATFPGGTGTYNAPPLSDGFSAGCTPGNNDGSVTAEQKEVVLLALREYMHTLRRNVVEQEQDSSRGLVLLSYGRDLLGATVKVALSGDSSHIGAVGDADGAGDLPVTTRPQHQYNLVDELRQMEGYIQRAAGQLKHDLPANQATGAVQASVMPFRETDSSDGGACHTSASTLQGTSLDGIPPARDLMLRRAVSLIRRAASEELVMISDRVAEGSTRVAGARFRSTKLQLKATWESAMVILRLLLQQVVIRLPLEPTRPMISEANECRPLRVLNVPLAPFTHEVDRRAVQTLLHKVEKYYRTCLSGV